VNQFENSIILAVSLPALFPVVVPMGMRQMAHLGNGLRQFGQDDI
jgi:hypothetical protein